MSREWTEQYLQQMAGWRAVKAGKELWRLGRLEGVRATDEKWFASSREGKRQHRFCVPTNPLHSDLLRCTCSEHAQTGSMCAHLVALALEVQAKLAQLQQSSRAAAVAQEKVAALPGQSNALLRAYRISLYPHWRREWQQGALTLKIEPSHRQAPDEADRLWQQWWDKQHDPRSQAPWVLPLRGEALDQALSAMVGHAEVIGPDGRIEVATESPILRISSQRAPGSWVLRLADEAGQFLGHTRQRWLSHQTCFYAIDDSNEQEMVFQLFAEKRLKVIDGEKLGLNKLLHLLRWDEQDPLAQLIMHEITATTRVRIDGSEAGLKLEVVLSYRLDHQVIDHQLGETDIGLLAVQAQHWLIADDAQQQEWRSRLKQMGWRRDGQSWRLAGEDAVLDFLSRWLPALQKIADDWQQQPGFNQLLQSLEVLQLGCDWSDNQQSGSQLRLQFHSLSGRAYDPQKIRQLLQSGKRVIKTAQGKRLILPSEQWDLLQRLLAETNAKAAGESFTVPESAIEAFHHFSEYLRKPLTINDNDQVVRDELDRATIESLRVKLRDYQSHGASWVIDRMKRYGGALLADEMGLGKTIQTIAVIQQLKGQGACALVVVPTSLMRNWQEEFRRVAPELQVQLVHGAQRELDRISLQSWDVLITSFGVLVRDRAWHLRQQYGLMVVDEASLIRNPETDVARTIFRLSAQWRLALTGTPIENGLRDLWSIFQYLRPGFLGERIDFTEKYEKLAADAPHRANVMQALRWRIAPMILRREKRQVARDLPEKIEIDQWCDLSAEQKSFYQQLLDEGKSRLLEAGTLEPSSQHMQLLTLLLRLRQTCCDLALVDAESQHQLKLGQRSSKMERLFEIMESTLGSGQKMLIFSQFSQQLAQIERDLSQRGIHSIKLDGQTRNRHELVERFQQESGPDVFLISLKAGGYGLNLTRASVVVHFDPWWNPAAESQASDRAHRIGQNRHVTIHRLLTRGTIEEQVRAMQWDKRQIAAGLHSQQEAEANPNSEVLRHLLKSATAVSASA